MMSFEAIFPAADISVADIQPLDNDVHIHVVRLDELTLSPGWETILAEADLERAARFQFDRDRDRFLRRRFLLRTILSAYVNIYPQDMVFEFSRQGKPGLAGNPVHFNLSESAGCCALAFSRHSPVGVDIEQIRPFHDLPLIAQQYFSNAERGALADMNSENRLAAFYHIWTQKEAFVKALGLGLSFPINLFDVEPYPDRPAGWLAIPGFPELETGWAMHSLLPFNDFRLAVAYSRNIANVRIIPRGTGFIRE